MAISRYSTSPRLNFSEQYGTSTAITNIRAAIARGELTMKETIIRGAERLDTLAGEIYGDARYWWVLAAASDIGWGLQVPPGTIIKIPDLNSILRIIG
jgi:nucleoid-associated protein YgaU